ncbi:MULTISPECIES: ABC transporter permease [unclassified Achromobacter]|jgi:peptide/nickel transport system permease protein|uniref:ABC transporter permease n=1 Tax=unclassified Achromobacter TaxID=2626865 RepID=UPI000B51D08C|nr:MULTISPECIES: ABC transporter permease [unclassified Achromobacter]OWT75453.1 ABC transporter permease [Achromobacter sp. HZ28]OWT76113.1 ABC transporter permease [Achromobacter sp. HZ34]
MLRYFLRRLVYTLPIALGVTLVCFALVHLAPGDPISAVLPENASASVVQEIKAAYGFDKPLPLQYLIWLGRVTQGDLGMSIKTGRPVSAEIGPAIANSMLLAAASIFLAFVGGCALGALAGYTRRRGVDRTVTAVAVTGVSLPHYWLGMVLIVFFSVELRWLPATGMGGPDLAHLILPAVTLAVIPMGIIARSVRASVSEIRRQEFVQTLYAKGLRGPQVFLHVAKNVAPTVMAVMGLQFAQMLGGSILVETVFSWPGTGFLLNSAIFTRDLPILQGTILVLAMLFVFTNLIVDVLQMLVDPRVKRA